MVEIVFLIVYIEEAEDLEDLICDLFICSQKKMVSIHSCSILIEVSGAYCRVPLGTIILRTRDKAQLCMNLQPRHSINNPYAFLHKLVTPEDIGFLVEPCLELYH